MSESIRGDERDFLGSWAGEAFIIITGPVKATWLSTVLMHTKTPRPLNGLPAGLFMVMRFSLPASHENEDPVLSLAQVMAELFHLHCFSLGLCVQVPTMRSTF